MNKLYCEDIIIETTDFNENIIMDTIIIILCVLFAIVDPLCYVISRNNGLREAKGWKKIIPFCWVFA